MAIKSTTDPAGSSPYTFPYNPSEFDHQDSLFANSVELLHGAPSWQKQKFDYRPRTFRWFAVGVTSTVDSRAKMVDYMRPWVGTVRYFNFDNLVRANANWPNHTTWNKARVIDLKTVIRRGGTLRYDTVELVIQPES